MEISTRPEFAGTVPSWRPCLTWDEQADVLFRKGYDMIKSKWTNGEAKQEFSKMGS